MYLFFEHVDLLQPLGEHSVDCVAFSSLGVDILIRPSTYLDLDTGEEDGPVVRTYRGVE